MHFKQDFYGKTGGGVRKGVEKKPAPVLNQKAKGRGRGRGKTYEEPGGCRYIISPCSIFPIVYCSNSPFKSFISSSASSQSSSFIILHSFSSSSFATFSFLCFPFLPFLYFTSCIILFKIVEIYIRPTGLTVSSHVTSPSCLHPSLQLS